MDKKIKLNFIVDTLAQHGAERYLYEIVSKLNQDSFDITVTSIVYLDESNNFYQKKIEDLGVAVKQIKYGVLYPEMNSKILKKIKTSLTYRMCNFFGMRKKLESLKNQALVNILGKYDIISVIKINAYLKYQEIFKALDTVCIHLLSTIVQYDKNPYTSLTNNDLNIITMYEQQKNEVLEGIKINEQGGEMRFFNYPLTLDFSNRVSLYNPHSDEIRIGVFTRISYDQPSIFNFFHFHLLTQRYSNAVLYFYGQCYDEEYFRLIQQTIQILNIEDKVFFKGHVQDIGKAVYSDQLTIGWMNIFNQTMGYSSLEIMSFGLPILFFNTSSDKNFRSPKEIEIHNNLSSLLQKSLLILRSEEQLLKMSKEAIRYIVKEHNSANLIPALEKFYRDIL